MKLSIRSTVLILVLATLAACSTAKEETKEIPATSFESPSVSPSISPSVLPSPIATFQSVFKRKLDEKKSQGAATAYAEGMYKAWGHPTLSPWGLVSENACDDLKEYDGDVEKISEVAHRVNGYTEPLEAYKVYYEIKFSSAKEIGCN